MRHPNNNIFRIHLAVANLVSYWISRNCEKGGKNRVKASRWVGTLNSKWPQLKVSPTTLYRKKIYDIDIPFHNLRAIEQKIAISYTRKFAKVVYFGHNMHSNRRFKSINQVKAINLQRKNSHELNAKTRNYWTTLCIFSSHRMNNFFCCQNKVEITILITSFQFGTHTHTQLFLFLFCHSLLRAHEPAFQFFFYKIHFTINKETKLLHNLNRSSQSITIEISLKFIFMWGKFSWAMLLPWVVNNCERHIDITFKQNEIYSVGLLPIASWLARRKRGRTQQRGTGFFRLFHRRLRRN